MVQKKRNAHRMTQFLAASDDPAEKGTKAEEVQMRSVDLHRERFEDELSSSSESDNSEEIARKQGGLVIIDTT